MPSPAHHASRWTRSLPDEPGFWELWDPTCRVNRIIEIYAEPGGALVIRAPRGGVRDLPLRLFPRNPAHGISWCGPIRVPDQWP
jgi:hypothetical protein